MMPTANRPRVSAILAAILIWPLAACGTSSHPPELPTDASPGSIHNVVTGSGGTQFLSEISTYPWPDKGQRAGNLFAWISPDSNSADVNQAAQAGGTAHAVASFLADHTDGLLAIDGNKSVGAVNPVLLQSHSSALIPYLGALVGDKAATRGLDPLDDLSASMPRTTRLFEIMQTGPTPSTSFNDAAQHLASTYIDSFAEAAKADQPPHRANLLFAAKLLGLVQAGTNLSRHTKPDPLTASRSVDEVTYAIVSRLAKSPNPDVAAKFFKPDGQLMSPTEAATLGNTSYSDYSSQLQAFLNNQTKLWEFVQAFREQYLDIVGPS